MFGVGLVSAAEAGDLLIKAAVVDAGRVVVQIAAFHFLIVVVARSVAVEIEHLCLDVFDLKITIEMLQAKVADVARRHLSNLEVRLGDFVKI